MCGESSCNVYLLLHSTVGSYLRDVLQEGSGDTVACLEIEIEIFYSNTSKTGWSLWAPLML
jgi:hypothetical protein